MQPAPRKLLDQVRDAIRRKHYAYSTEQTYVQWIKRFILFHNKRHPEDMGRSEVEAFLTHLAVEKNVAASTQNQAFSAILFLYRDVLHRELDFPIEALRATKPKRLPTVLTKEEARQVIGHLSGINQLMAKLLYGSGLRLMECLRLRVKGLDFGQRQIIVRDGKGQKDRVTMLPEALIGPLQEHLARVERLHEETCPKAIVRCSFPLPWSASIPMRIGSGSGSMSFYRSGSRWTLAAVPCAATIWTRVVCKKPSEKRPVGGPHQAGRPPYLSPQFCHPSVGKRLRHQDCPRAPRPQGCADNHDLHARDA